jgi:hypothetical protein
MQTTSNAASRTPCQLPRRLLAEAWWLVDPSSPSGQVLPFAAAFWKLTKGRHCRLISAAPHPAHAKPLAGMNIGKGLLVACHLPVAASHAQE